MKIGIRRRKRRRTLRPQKSGEVVARDSRECVEAASNEDLAVRLHPQGKKPTVGPAADCKGRVQVPVGIEANQVFLRNTIKRFKTASNEGAAIVLDAQRGDPALDNPGVRIEIRIE